GFSSIVADGGVALRPPFGVTVTSGNSLTAWSAQQAIQEDCARRGVPLARSTVAIVGATGAIGHVLSLLLAECVGRLILVGNPKAPESSLWRLREVADDCAQHVARLAADGRRFPPGSAARGLLDGVDPAALIEATTDLERRLPQADVVVAATSTTTTFIAASQ